MSKLGQAWVTGMAPRFSTGWESYLLVHAGLHIYSCHGQVHTPGLEQWPQGRRSEGASPRVHLPVAL